jgi:hypothetical protein
LKLLTILLLSVGPFSLLDETPSTLTDFLDVSFYHLVPRNEYIFKNLLSNPYAAISAIYYYLRPIMVTENYVIFNSLERSKPFYYFYRRLNRGTVMLFLSPFTSRFRNVFFLKFFFRSLPARLLFQAVTNLRLLAILPSSSS